MEIINSKNENILHYQREYNCGYDFVSFTKRQIHINASLATKMKLKKGDKIEFAIENNKCFVFKSASPDGFKVYERTGGRRSFECQRRSLTGFLIKKFSLNISKGYNRYFVQVSDKKVNGELLYEILLNKKVSDLGVSNQFSFSK